MIGIDAMIDQWHLLYSQEMVDISKVVSDMRYVSCINKTVGMDGMEFKEFPYSLTTANISWTGKRKKNSSQLIFEFREI